jgi:hypothetical protein
MIACRFYKKVIAHCLDNRNQTLQAAAQRHLRECPACRQFYQLECELTRRLAAGAEDHAKSPSPFLRGKIMTSLDRPREEAAPAHHVLRLGWVTALLVIGLAWFTLSSLRTVQHSNRQGGQPAPLSLQTAPEPRHIPPLTGRNIFEWSKALDEPLEAEMNSVVSDARTAIQLLAQNFLPDSLGP